MIDAISGGNQFAHLVVGDDNVALLVRWADRQVRFPRHPGSECACRAAPPCSSAAHRQRQSRLIVDGAIVPSRPSRHFFSSVAVSTAAGF